MSSQQSPTSFLTQLKRSFVLAKKDLKIYYNKPPVLIQGIIFPIILFFAMTVGREVEPIYTVSGLMAMVIFLTSTSIGPIVFPWETMRRTFERLVTCPVSLTTILLGSMWSSAVYGMIFSLVPLILGALFLSEVLIFNLLVIMLGVLVSGLVFAAFSLILSVPSTDSPGNTMVFTILIKFPLVFISPLFMPITPNIASYISPLTYFVDIINVGLGGTSAFGSLGLLVDVGVLLLFGACLLLLAIGLHKKTVENRFQ